MKLLVHIVIHLTVDKYFMYIRDVFLMHPYPCLIPYLGCFVVLGFEMVDDCIRVSVYHKADSAVNVSECGDFVILAVYFYFAVHANVNIVGFVDFVHKVCGEN